MGGFSTNGKKTSRCLALDDDDEFLHGIPWVHETWEPRQEFLGKSLGRPFLRSIPTYQKDGSCLPIGSMGLVWYMVYLHFTINLTQMPVMIDIIRRDPIWVYAHCKG